MSYRKLEKNLYEITIEVGNDITGKRKRIKRRVHGTREEAILKHAELEKQYFHKSKKVNLNDMTFSEYSKIFINNYCKNNISKITTKDYEQMLKRILPLLGDIKLKKINTFMLDKLYQKLKIGVNGKELAPKTMSHYYNLICLSKQKSGNLLIATLTRTQQNLNLLKEKEIFIITSKYKSYLIA